MTAAPPKSKSKVLRAIDATLLHEREALTLAEAAALGYGSERSLRAMISTGRLKRCVLRNGVRGKRLLRAVLIEELQARK